MRIGLFSDAYLPTVNGISYVLQIMRARLEELGHEVYIFAPATNLRGEEPGDDDRVYRFPAVEGVFFDEQLTSVFFPYRDLRKIKKMNLDIIHFFTPAQIGLMGAYTAIRLNIPLVSQYSTDLYHYVEEYKSVLPGTIALSMMAPFMLKMTPRQTIKMLSILRPQRDVTQWHKDMVARMHVMLHDHCDAVVALSLKMQKQLDSWGSSTDTTLLPTGVDKIPTPPQRKLGEFKQRLGISDGDTVLLYVGRPSREKNLDLLIDSFDAIADAQKNVKLVFVGDGFDRESLETEASRLQAAENVIFAGRLPREELGVAYGIGDVFLFPSMTDTQGLVINEAAAAGLPLVLCDGELAGVFVDGMTGMLAPNDAHGFATVVIEMLKDKKRLKTFGAAARQKALEYSEIGQMEKVATLYETCIENHKKISFAGGDW